MSAARARDTNPAEITRQRSTIDIHALRPSKLAADQGHTLVHISAKHKRFQWDRGCA